MKQLLSLTARMLSLASTGIIAAFIIGEGLSGMTWSEAVAFLLFPVGVIIGFAISWWRSAIGAYVSLASLAAFYLVLTLQSGRFPGGLAFLVFTSPAILFLIESLIPRNQTSAQASFR